MPHRNDPTEGKSPARSSESAPSDPRFPARDGRPGASSWEDDAERNSLASQEWEQEDSRRSPEELLDGLQCIFHQMGPTVDGAATSLNAILQGPYFDDDSLMQLTGGGPMDAYAINLALRSFNLSLQPADTQRSMPEPQLENAFMIYQFKRWFPLRRVAAHWLNLSERVLRPVQIYPWHLSLSLGQLEDDGCAVYVVRGRLPRCPADENRLFDEHFRWPLDGGIMAPEEVVADTCEGLCEGECTCYELSDEAYEDELQAAIEASLADAQPAKGLAIKTSPPTSLVSSEERVGSSLSLKGDTSIQERDDNGS